MRAQSATSLDDSIAAWLQKHFALKGNLHQLPGYSDLNFRLTTTSGDIFVCKFCQNPDEAEQLIAQHEVLSLLQEKNLAAIPRVITTIEGSSLVPFEHDGQTWLGRILTYVTGKLLAEHAPYDANLLYNFGRTLGQFDQSLLEYSNPAFDYKFDWDLTHALEVVECHRDLIGDATLRGQVNRIHAMFSEQVVPRFPELRKSVIHNDANEYNVLAEGDHISGLIDFGDMVHSYTVCDPAIAMAYATLGSDDPAEVIREMTRGYHESLPLQDSELIVLFPMLCMRLAVSACMAAYQMRLRPDDSYLAISQEPIRKTLPQLLRQDCRTIHSMLREVVS